jgi:5-enolpyruvylshikimate-3-phosphate synthase
MSMAIAALAASGKSAIDDIGCVNKSFPGFFGTLEGLYVK